uniref:Uncharacterized protein n=1 Tax=Tanacetum cinerariifolium TaxID=118510 RepID=A0A6L2JYN9_TANCI|nr:hypothetical protein [Tanacetum cinerariifolium]
MKKVEPSSRSKAIKDIISIGSFMEALVLNRYVLSGSVETQGESSAVAASERMPYCDMGRLAFSQSNALEAGESYTEFVTQKNEILVYRNDKGKDELQVDILLACQP